MSSFVPDPLDDCLSPSGEEPRNSEHPQDPGRTNLVISEMAQVVIMNMLATLYLVIAMLFRFVASSVPGTLDVILPPLIEEPGHPESSSDPETQRIAIISIRATGLMLGFRRIPAGFHVTVTTDGAEWQTSSMPVHVDQAVVEWNERILLPSEPISKVLVSVYASFELGPMLGHGELLRTFEISIGELLDRSEKSNPIIFQPKAGEVISSCTSLFMTVVKRHFDQDDATVYPTIPSTSCDALILRTDASHRLLARYSRTQNSRDLDESITHFGHASDLCPVGHPCRPAALFNLASAKVVSCQGNETSLELDIAISLFQDTLDLRPTGHLDRAVTQLYLAVALLSRFAKRRFQADADAAEELLSDVLRACLANSHVYRAAVLVIEASALHQAGSIDVNDPGQEQPVGSMLPLSPNQLTR